MNGKEGFYPVWSWTGHIPIWHCNPPISSYPLIVFSLFQFFSSVSLLRNMIAGDLLLLLHILYLLLSFPVHSQTLPKPLFEILQSSANALRVLSKPQAPFKYDWLLLQWRFSCFLYKLIKLTSSSSAMLDTDPVSLKAGFHREHFLYGMWRSNWKKKRKFNLQFSPFPQVTMQPCCLTCTLH